MKRRSGCDIGFGSARKASFDGVTRFRQTSSTDGLGYDGSCRRSSNDLVMNTKTTELEEYPIAIAIRTRTQNAYDPKSLSFQVCVLDH